MTARFLMMAIQWTAALAITLWVATAWAHAGPPFPIVEDRASGPYVISVWTDPDATDNGTAGARFWVMVRPTAGGTLPADTRVVLSARLQGGAGVASSSAPATPSGSNPFFAALELKREGSWLIQSSVDGSLGRATVSAPVDATYDLRPSRPTTIVFVLPFIAVGVLWLKAILRRRSTTPACR